MIRATTERRMNIGPQFAYLYSARAYADQCLADLGAACAAQVEYVGGRLPWIVSVVTRTRE